MEAASITTRNRRRLALAILFACVLALALAFIAHPPIAAADAGITSVEIEIYDNGTPSADGNACSGTGWSYSDTSLILFDGHAFTFTGGSCRVKVLNYGTIEDGGFSATVNNSGTITGGSFASVNNKLGATIAGGTFAGEGANLNNYGTIISGSFHCPVTPFTGAKITGGEFYSTVQNYSSESVTIAGGTFFGAVDIKRNSVIEGGTFKGRVSNNGTSTIKNGVFNGDVTNIARIEGGEFHASVYDNDRATISGGIFHGFVRNDDNAMISAGAFFGAVTNRDNAQISGGMFSGVVTNEGNGKISGGEFLGGIVNNGLPIDDTSVLFNVTSRLSRLASTGAAQTQNGVDYEATLAAEEGYALPNSVAITLNGNAGIAGTDYSYDAATGKLVVFAASEANKGPITIEASAAEIPVALLPSDNAGATGEMKSLTTPPTGDNIPWLPLALLAVGSIGAVGFCSTQRRKQ